MDKVVDITQLKCCGDADGNGKCGWFGRKTMTDELVCFHSSALTFSRGIGRTGFGRCEHHTTLVAVERAQEMYHDDARAAMAAQIANDAIFQSLVVTAEGEGSFAYQRIPTAAYAQADAMAAERKRRGHHD